MTTLTERDVLTRRESSLALLRHAAFLMSDDSITSATEPAEVIVPPMWLGRVKQRIRELEQLRPDWDSYGASPVHPRIPPLATDLVEWFAVDAIPPPDVFATPEGGVQLEWHIHGVDVEINISPDGTTVSFRDLRSRDEWSRQSSSTALHAVRHRLLRR